MASASSYREIQDRVLDLLGRSDSITRNRVKNWINLGQSDFVLREAWPFRETTGTLALVQGTQEYSLVSNFADIDAQNILGVSLQGANNAKLIYWPYNQLRNLTPDFDYDAQGLPTRYYLKSGSIGFVPVPNGVDSVAIDYYKTPTELSADADVSIIPANYREALIHYALSMEHDYDSDPDLAQKSSNRYEELITSARMNLLSQPTDIGNFTILGPQSLTNHTDVR